MAQFANRLPLQRQVEFELLRQFMVELLAPPAKDEVAPETRQRCVHVWAHAMLRTFSIAPTRRANSARSDTSCFRPAAVNV